MSKYDMDRGLYDYNARANRAMKSPGFAVGELLGNIWSKKYNDRGNAKAIDAALEKYGENPTQVENDAALEQVESDKKAEAYKNLGTYDIKTIGDLAEKYGLNNPMSSAINEMSYLNNPANFNDGSEFSKRRLSEIAQDDKIVDSLKSLGYGLEPKQDIVQQAVNARAVSQQVANDRMNNFNAKDALSNIQLDLIKKGYTQDQINTITGALGDKFQAVQDKMSEQKTNDIVGNLSKINPSSAEYQEKLIELAKFNPNAANMLYKNVVTGKDVWQSGEKKGLMQQSFANSKDMADYQVGLKKDLLNYTNNQKYEMLIKAGLSPEEAKQAMVGVRRGGIGGTDKIDMTSYKIASDIAEKGEKKMFDEFGKKTDYQLSDLEKRAIAYRDAFAGKLFLGGNKEAEKPKINFNDYNQAMPFFKKIIDTKKYAKEDIIKGIRQSYGLNPDDTSNNFVEDIISGLGLKTNVTNKQDNSITQKDLDELIEKASSLEREN